MAGTQSFSVAEARNCQSTEAQLGTQLGTQISSDNSRQPIPQYSNTFGFSQEQLNAKFDLKQRKSETELRKSEAELRKFEADHIATKI